MELKLIHLFPSLMNLYGSYANLTLLQRRLEALGHTVSIISIEPGQPLSELSDAAFVYMGAGTESSRNAALKSLSADGHRLVEMARNGLPMLFAGTAMDLLGKELHCTDGTVLPCLGLADYVTKDDSRRHVEDVYGIAEITNTPVIGFMNKCTTTKGIDHPLLKLSLGFGNEGSLGFEGYQEHRVLASQLTGPLLVKNPRLMDWTLRAIAAHCGFSLPDDLPSDPWTEDGFRMAEEQLRLRFQKG